MSNNVVCATSKGSDQPAHMPSLIRAFAGQMNILLTEQHLEFLSLKETCSYTCQNATLFEITCHGSYAMDAHLMCL